MRVTSVIRSSLTPYFHKGRRKWYARGTYPIRLADGTIERRRGYVGAGSDTRSACQIECDRLNAELEADARDKDDRFEFGRAVATYVSQGHENRFIHPRVIAKLGPIDCRAITTEMVAQLAQEIYPNAKPSTVNRQLYTPIIAVLNLAAEGKNWTPKIRRPRGHAERPEIKIPDDEWWSKVLEAANPQLKAMLLFLRVHGRRRGDALKRVPSDFDPKRGTIMIGKTKNGSPILIRLAKPVIDAIKAYSWENGPGLFGTLTQKNARGAHRQLDRLCARLNIPRFTFHPAGRHSFATEKIRDRKHGVKHTQHAGGWEDGKSMDGYIHLEYSDVDEATKREGEEWVRKVTKRGRKK